jgi:hypothetical protein
MPDPWLPGEVGGTVSRRGSDGYDDYNFLVIGFGPTRRASDAILSLAAHARGVNLCFLQRGPELPDLTSILRSGEVVGTVALDSPDDLDRPDVSALIEVALGLATTPWMPRTTEIWSASRHRPSSVPAADGVTTPRFPVIHEVVSGQHAAHRGSSERPWL